MVFNMVTISSVSSALEDLPSEARQERLVKKHKDSFLSKNHTSIPDVDSIRILLETETLNSARYEIIQ